MPGRLIKDDSIIEVSVPFAVKRRGGRQQLSTKIHAVKGGTVLWPGRKELVIPIALGHVWARLLESGNYKSLNSLATFLDKDPSQVMKYVRLTNLAPDIIDAILAGQEPEGMKQDHLLQQLPLAWTEQRQLLGFPGLGSQRADSEIDLHHKPEAVQEEAPDPNLQVSGLQEKAQKLPSPPAAVRRQRSFIDIWEGY